MKKYLLSMLALMLVVFAFADVYTIGTGTTGSYTAPYNGWYDHSWSKSVYTLAELNAAGLTAANSITDIGFFVTNTPSNYTMLDQRVYVRHSDATNYETTDVDHPDRTLFHNAFAGNLTYNGGGWFTISFSAPFAWNGTQGLEFLFENHDGAYVTGYPNFAYTSTSPNYLMVSKAQDDSFPEGIVGARSYSRPNIQLYTPIVTPPGPATVVSPVDGASLVSVIPTLTWGSVYGATGYRIYVGTDPVSPASEFLPDLGNVTSYNPAELLIETQYYWKVVPYNTYGFATGCPVWSFTTSPAGLVVIGNGIATSRFPLGSWYGYERSAALYTAAEIGAGNKRINTVAWYATAATDVAIPTKIYMKSYSGNTITTANWAEFITGATPVYENTHQGIVANDWNVIALNNTFDLDSGNNLLVLIERNAGGGGNGTSTGPAIRGTNISNMHLTWQQDNSPPTSNGTAATSRPNLMFVASSYTITDPPSPALAVSPANNATMVALDAQLNWVSGGGAPTGYKLYFGISNPPAFIGDLGDVTTYDPGMLTTGITYYWQVVPYNGSGDAAGCPVWSFSTLPPGMVTIGDGTATSSYPFYSLYEAARTQMLFGASELLAAGAIPGGMINNLAYDIITANGIVLNDLMIRIKHTNSESLTAFEEGDFETVYLNSEALSGTGWYYFNLQTPFNWNGSQNLLVDVSFTNTSWSGNSSIRATAVAGKTWAYNADGATGSTMTGGAAQANRPNTRLVMSDPPSGPAAAPLLTYPVNGATGLPIEGFNLTWAPDLVTGGMPDYYAVYMSNVEDDIYSDFYDETTDTHYNPVTEGGLTFSHNQRWYWAVQAVNTQGDGVSGIRRFDIIAAPPQIAVNPASISENLEVGGSSTQMLTITNNGGLPLNYSIGFAETPAPAPVRAQIGNLVPNPNAHLMAEIAPNAGSMAVGSSRALYDLQFAFAPTSGTGEYGVVSDGEYIYTSQWNTPAGSCNFYKYDLSGALLETINVPGLGAIRDFSYDGEYFYGTASSTTIYKFDLSTATMLGTITAPVAARGITYDPNENGLWITNGWNAPLYLLAMDGTTLRTLNTSAANLAGIAYDEYSDAPVIWANTQNGTFTNTIVKIDAADGTVLESFELTDSLLPALHGESSAGGINIVSGLAPGFATILATSQNDVIYGLELCPTSAWAATNPRSGVVAPGTSANIDVNFNTTGLAAGVYNGALNIRHNAPTPEVQVPLTLTITGEWLPAFSIAPNAWDFEESEELNPVTKQFTITNTGGPGLNLNAASFYITNDTEGNFQIEANGLPVSLAYNENYRFNVVFIPQSPGAKVATLNINDGLTRQIHQIPLMGTGVTEPIGEIINLQANVQNLTDVLLTWGVGTGVVGTPGWLHYDADNVGNAIGAGAGAVFDVAAKFTSSTLYPYSGMQITQMMYHPSSPATEYTLKIWSGSDASLAPGTLIHQQTLTGVISGTMNTVNLSTPITVSGSQALWVGYGVAVDASAIEDDRYPAGCDEGPAVAGLGNLIQYQGTWYQLTDLGASLTGNWNIRAYVDVASTLSHNAPLLSIPVINEEPNRLTWENRQFAALIETPQTQQRVLRGFNVYRNGSQINTALIPTPTYLDQNLADGSYNYTVQGVYYSQNTAMSDPVTVVVAAPAPFAMPFTETWDSGNFTENMWMVSGSNWSIDATGNPTPSAKFSWSPQVTNYSLPITSYNIDGTGYDDITLSFDLFLNNYSTDAENLMYWEVYDGSAWQTVGSYSSLDGSLPWTVIATNISAHAANRVFKIRFIAAGEDSYEINNWNLDNITVAESPSVDTIPPIISHNPHLSTPITNAPYTIAAEVEDDPFWDNPIAYVNLYWSPDTFIWSAPVSMSFADGVYSGQIPAQELGTYMLYYIEAADSEGNISESEVFGFMIDNPAWLGYDTGTGSYITFGQEFGPAVVFDNPFYPSGVPMQLLYTDGSTYAAQQSLLVVYELVGTSWTPVFSDYVNFSAQSYNDFDLEDEAIIIEGSQFMVAYMGIPGSNGFLFDDTYNYGTSRVIIGGSLYNVADPGQWAIGALVTNAPSLDAPVVTMALNAAGNPELSWAPVPGANAYAIETSADPYAAVWTPVTTTDQTSHVVSSGARELFFRVIAGQISIAKRQNTPVLNTSNETLSGASAIQALKDNNVIMKRK